MPTAGTWSARTRLDPVPQDRQPAAAKLLSLPAYLFTPPVRCLLHGTSSPTLGLVTEGARIPASVGHTPWAGHDVPGRTSPRSVLGGEGPSAPPRGSARTEGVSGPHRGVRFPDRRPGACKTLLPPPTNRSG